MYIYIYIYNMDIAGFTPVGSGPGVLCLSPSHVIHNHSERSCIIHLPYWNILADHLLVDAVHALQPALHTTDQMSMDKQRDKNFLTKL